MLASISILANCKAETTTTESAKNGILSYQYTGVNVETVTNTVFSLLSKITTAPSSILPADLSGIVVAATTVPTPASTFDLCFQATNSSVLEQLVTVSEKVNPQGAVVETLRIQQATVKNLILNTASIPEAAFYLGSITSSSDIAVKNSLRAGAANRMFGGMSTVASETAIQMAALPLATIMQATWNTNFGGIADATNTNITYAGLLPTTFGTRAETHFKSSGFNVTTDKTCKTGVTSLAAVADTANSCILDAAKIKTASTDVAMGGFGNLQAALTKGDVTVYSSSQAFMSVFRTVYCTK